MDENFTLEKATQPVLKIEKLMHFLDQCQALNKDPIEYAKEIGIDIKNEYGDLIKRIVSPKFKDSWNVGRFEVISKIDSKLNPECQGKEGCVHYQQMRKPSETCNTGMCTRRILKEMERLENLK